MGNKCVTLHFSKSHTSFILSAANRLPRSGDNRTRGTHLKLVIYHVAESLVKHRANENISAEFSASHSRVHGFVAVEVQAQGAKLVTNTARSCL